LLIDQFFVCQRFCFGLCVKQNIKQVLSLLRIRRIRSPAVLVNVTLQMLRRNVMITADYAALEQRPEALYGVGVNIAK